MTIWFVYTLLSNSVHLVLSLGTNAFTRRIETEADNYSVECGYGRELYSGMIRFFNKNKLFIFGSPVTEVIHRSHPSLLTRLANIKKQI